MPWERQFDPEREPQRAAGGDRDRGGNWEPTPPRSPQIGRPQQEPIRVAGRPIVAGGVPASYSEREPSDPEGKAVQVIRRYIALENSRDYESIEQLFHPSEFVCHPWFGSQPIAPQAETRMLRGLFRAFPDWKMEINEIIYGDDDVCVGKITGRGTQVRSWMNRPPSDKQIAIPLVHCINVRDGRIVRYTSTVPWRDPFSSDYVSSEDVQSAEATQGREVSRTERALQQAVEHGVVDRDALTQLDQELDVDRNQCQSLLESNMRRCTSHATPGSIYCEWHNEYGYGIDGPDERYGDTR